MLKSVFESPVGKIVAVADATGICSLDFDENATLCQADHPHLKQLHDELKEYFEGKRQRFDVPLHPKGTPFQMAVWRILCDIPYGHTISYTQEAQMLSHPTAMRAVGNANGKNPIPIIIPCHRVIAKGGDLGGYSGGLWRKKFLIELERSVGCM